MKGASAYAFLALLGGALFSANACSDDPDGGSPASTSGSGGATSTGGSSAEGGTAGAGGNASNSSGGGMSQTSGSGGAPSCMDALEGECGECMELLCCSEISDCLANSGCKECLIGNDLECADPTASALLNGVFACSKQLCQSTCFGPVDIYGCNPITNAGCDRTSDFACDVDLINGAFICTGPPHTQALCEACSPQDGFCAGGHTCVGNKCARFCCDDNDCGANNVCDKSYFSGVGMGEAGVCMDAQSPVDPACTGLPATAPSGGSCIPFSG